MKILKYLLLFVLALVVFFFALGLINPTIKYGHSITVDKPVKEAWSVQQDLDKFDQWLEGFKSIELISGNMGEVGSKYKVVVKPDEETPDFEMIETMVSKKDFDHMTLAFDSDMMRFDQTTSFSESNGKTTITTDSKVSGNGLVMRSMLAAMNLFGGGFQKQEVENVERLKKVIEENTTDYYPAPVMEEQETDDSEDIDE